MAITWRTEVQEINAAPTTRTKITVDAKHTLEMERLALNQSNKNGTVQQKQGP